MYYIDFTVFMGNPDKAWMEIKERENQNAQPKLSLFDQREAYFMKNIVRSPCLLSFELGFYAVFVFNGQQ
jgi:hypothetical protein